MRIAIWCRVSTIEQETSNQLLALQRDAERRGGYVVRVWEISQSAYSGDHHDDLESVFLAAERKEFDVLLIWALDRLERGGIEQTIHACQRLWTAGVTVASLQESWLEQPGPMRDLLIAIFAWVAKMESTRRRERVLAGMARARSEGKHMGRPEGSKDKTPRKRTGYFMRYDPELRKRHPNNSRPNKAIKQIETPANGQ